MNIQIFYRISDKEKAKCKLPGANKIRCLNNCLDVFKNNITIIADNCSELLLNDLKNKNLQKKLYPNKLYPKMILKNLKTCWMI